MIRYALGCDHGHNFESWFPSGASFDVQSARGLVECPACGSTEVGKRLMAPSLGRRAREPAPASANEVVVPPAQPDVPVAPPPAALLDERDQAIRAMLRAVREHVTKTADYVGPSFADKARRMHHGEIEHRSIYGEANADDAKALIEEGIEVHPLPIMPDDRN